MSMTKEQARRLGKLLAAARLRLAMTLRDVEARSGIPRAWLGRVEQGSTLNVQPERLARLCELLQIPPSRIDRISRGVMAAGLPEPRVYFRAKLDLSEDEAAQVERYIRRLRGKS